MKKLLVLFFCTVLLVGCGSNEDVAENDTSDLEIEEKRDEMSASAIMAYMEQMTGKYVMADTYENKSAEQQKHLDKALTDINIAILDIEDNYHPDMLVVKDLNDLADSISFAINELLAGEYSTKIDNARDVGYYVGEIARNYLDGELPPTFRIITGKENAND